MRDCKTVIAMIALRDGPNCYLCGEPEDAWGLDDPFEVEHVRPRAAGGGGDVDDISNLALAHRSCNRDKGTSAVIR